MGKASPLSKNWDGAFLCVYEEREKERREKREREGGQEYHH